MAKKEICIVIGASHAGVNFAFNLRKKGWKGEITLYDSESLFPYQKPPLSKSYLINENPEQNFIKPFEGHIGRSHFIRMNKGGHFPPHRDHKLPDIDTMRLFIPIHKCNPPDTWFMLERTP